MVKVIKSKKIRRISQGDIYENVPFIQSINFDERKNEISTSSLKFPYIIVLTQDCDLLQDYKNRIKNRPNQDKFLLSALIAPLYNKEDFIQGEHLSEFGYSMRQINGKKTEGKKILSNQDQRYHFLEFPDNIPIPPSIIDFKHYFSIDIIALRSYIREHFICKLGVPYREDISQRFSSYLSRIGLP